MIPNHNNSSMTIAEYRVFKNGKTPILCMKINNSDWFPVEDVVKHYHERNDDMIDEFIKKHK